MLNVVGDITCRQLPHHPGIGLEHHHRVIDMTDRSPGSVVHARARIVMAADHTIPNRDWRSAVPAFRAELARLNAVRPSELI